MLVLSPDLFGVREKTITGDIAPATAGAHSRFWSYCGCRRSCKSLYISSAISTDPVAPAVLPPVIFQALDQRHSAGRSTKPAFTGFAPSTPLAVANSLSDSNPADQAQANKSYSCRTVEQRFAKTDRRFEDLLIKTGPIRCDPSADPCSRKVVPGSRSPVTKVLTRLEQIANRPAALPDRSKLAA